MYQFFVEPSQIQGTRIVITGGDVNHIRNVLRMKAGEEIAVSNGIDGKEYRCGIETFTDDEVICTLRFIKEDGVELASGIYLFQGLPKADKMELIVQKAVELGACEVIPVAMKRCVVRLDEKKAAAKRVRWQGISEAAAKQSKRAVIPQVCPVMSFKEAVAYAQTMDVRLIPYELAQDMQHTKALIGAVRPGQKIAVFIGPEGGFEENEIQAALEAGIEPITLGRRILRTETAGFTVISWLMYQLEQ
ncbi:MAG: 16S rRNA (uracil(1498)-N(3))-methyltransferase [Lachnospiraceae bacterium]|nr:16S rRNA (uracil(1498)-N(3))-methyltransferase [Lachnospiraceae bacterium]